MKIGDICTREVVFALALCGLTEAEVHAIAQHEGLTEIAAAQACADAEARPARI